MPLGLSANRVHRACTHLGCSTFRASDGCACTPACLFQDEAPDAPRRILALKIQRSAAKYTEAAVDEITLCSQASIGHVWLTLCIYSLSPHDTSGIPDVSAWWRRCEMGTPRGLPSVYSLSTPSSIGHFPCSIQWPLMPLVVFVPTLTATWSVGARMAAMCAWSFLSMARICWRSSRRAPPSSLRCSH